MQSLKCSKLTLIWKNENKLESLHIMASETSSSNLQVQFKEIPNEDVGQDETLWEVIAVLETNDYNSDIENMK
jgi:hypothetical protein